MSNVKPIGYGGVNCYLVKGHDGFVLIDTGYPKHRAEIDREIEGAGCEPKGEAGNLRLIVVTHGDSDHCGNVVHLRGKYGGKVALHRDELGAVEQGDMLASRKNKPFIARIVFPFFRLKKADRFTPAITVSDGDTLTGYGLDARVVHIPGHSTGSIGILMDSGDLFCGDLFTNTKGPALNSLMDDKEAAAASLEKLRSMTIGMVYPGHGDPFEMAQLG